MTKIAKNTVVTMHYTLTLDDKTEVDSSAGSEPLVFLFGAGLIIPGLETALAGKAKGDKLNVRVTPDQGYGQVDEELRRQVPKTAFGPNADLQEGMQFETEMDDRSVVFTIVGVEGDKVFIDGNHPLAGETLNFDVSITDVRAATAEEISHGHVHGAGGHHH